MGSCKSFSMKATNMIIFRCGMVYVDSDELKWMPYVRSWLAKMNITILNQEMKEFLLTLFEHCVENGLNFVKKNCSYSIHQVKIILFQDTLFAASIYHFRLT